jgi:hypothetical protein
MRPRLVGLSIPESPARSRPGRPINSLPRGFCLEYDLSRASICHIDSFPGTLRVSREFFPIRTPFSSDYVFRAEIRTLFPIQLNRRFCHDFDCISSNSNMSVFWLSSQSNWSLLPESEAFKPCDSFVLLPDPPVVSSFHLNFSLIRYHRYCT